MRPTEKDEAEYIRVERIGTKYWTWVVRVPGLPVERCDGYVRSQAGAWDEARDALHNLLKPCTPRE